MRAYGSVGWCGFRAIWGLKFGPAPAGWGTLHDAMWLATGPIRNGRRYAIVAYQPLDLTAAQGRSLS